MKKIIINGPAKLQGRVSISGSKNAALPILFACIIANGVSEIEGKGPGWAIPDWGTKYCMLQLRSGAAK